MACFVVPAVEAIVVTAVTKAEEKKEMKLFETKGNVTQEKSSIPLSKKLKWLTKLLWGGVVLLLFEHIWHGEVVPWFPFLTAMGNPIDAAEMFHEMATVGVLMAVLCTAVWIIMCKVAEAIVKRPETSKSKGKA
ncbi:MAG: hypothetical protein K6E75_01980 [Lachnospiraceae bacterium]|nr:hypothetical protein [Lachnospiraceae bacterium]